MISFVVYFSTAQDKLGYVVLDGHGTAQAEFTGGPTLQPGTYRVEENRLTLIATPLTSLEQETL